MIQQRKGNLWGYIDARDAAQSCRHGLEADTPGAEASSSPPPTP